MNTSSRQKVFALIIFSFISAWSSFVLLPGLFTSWDLISNDQLFKLRYYLLGPRDFSPTIVHVDLDDPSLRDLPISSEDQRLYAAIINILNNAEVKGILFDMVFIRCEDQEKCDTLIDASENFGKAYYPVILRPKEESHQPEPDDPETKEKLQLPPNTAWHPNIIKEGNPIDARVAFLNYRDLEATAGGIAHITCYPDKDGIFRRFPLFIKTDEGLIPSLSFRMVLDYLKVTPERIDVTFGKHIVLHDAKFPDGRKKDITIPIDNQGKIIINFVGPWTDSYIHYSVAKLLEMGFDETLSEELIDEIEGSLVIMSDVSTGGRDFGSIPLESFYPLSGLHANVINSILREDFVYRLPPLPEVAIDTVLCLLIFLAALHMRGMGFALTTVLIYALYMGFSAWIFISFSTLSNVVRSSLGVVLALGSVNVFKYLNEEKEKAFIRASFESYFAPDLLDKILKSPDKLGTIDRKDLTIMFSDIKSFTSWSSTQNPTTIHSTLNKYFDEMAKIVFKYQGTIDKYIGDGLLVFFGDPIEYADHALRAAKASIEMQLKARQLKEQWSKEGGMPIEIRIGLNTGEVIVGNMGSEKRLDYTVIGANVNLAQRLESNAPVGGILVSASVNNAIQGELKTRPSGMVQMKGYEEKIETFEILIDENKAKFAEGVSLV